MLFGPFGRADQPLLFRVPAGDDDGALRSPSNLQQFADAVNRLQHGDGSVDGIHRTVDPRIAMVARDYPFVRILRPRNLADYVPDGPIRVLLPQVQFHANRARAYVIGERWGRALPAARAGLSVEMLENRLSIVRRRAA